jgi:TonB family protein
MATERYKLPELNGTEPTGKPVVPRGKQHDSQSRRLVIALVLLLIVLAAVVAKNGDFWFGTDVAESDSATSQVASNPAPAISPAHQQTQATQPQNVTPAATATAKDHRVAKAPAASAPSVAAKTTQPTTADSQEPVVATHRVVLPPLDVEVVAGDKHSTIHPGSNAIVTEIPADSNHSAAINASAASVTVNASQHERVSSVGTPTLRQAVEATYPALGQHSRVQGSVILEAVIGTDGVIEGLRVLSGPAILSNAAQQAVRQWHFKPYLQNGRAVETKCTVTVNFSIRVADESSNLS